MRHGGASNDWSATQLNVRVLKVREVGVAHRELTLGGIKQTLLRLDPAARK